MKAAKGFVLFAPVGEYVLLPAGEGMGARRTAVLMNEVSALIWRRLERGATRQELLDAILAEYAVDAETAGRDLDGLLHKLKALGLVEES